jgi:hypothetical protein
MIQIKKAVKYNAFGRAAFLGTAGCGKTYTALKVATAMLKGTGKRIFLLDTEHGSASKYADLFDFDTYAPESFSVDVYIEAIREADKQGYGVCIIDSLSHAWAGKDGILEFVDVKTAASKSGNAYTTGWRAATPKHNELVETILAAKMHMICTLRTKTEYIMQEDERGKKTPTRIGMEPIQRAGIEYEFDVIADLDIDNVMTIGKTRCPALKGKRFNQPGEEFATTFSEWLSGVETEAQGKTRLVNELKAVYPDPAKIKPALEALNLTYTVAGHDVIKGALFDYALLQNGKPEPEAA